MGSVCLPEAMLPPGCWSQISELQDEENALELFESKKPLKTVGGQWALTDTQQELRQLGTREKNMRERGWRCSLQQGQNVFLQRQRKLCWKDRVRTEAASRCCRRTNRSVWSLVSKASQRSEWLKQMAEKARLPRASSTTWRESCF